MLTLEALRAPADWEVRSPEIKYSQPLGCADADWSQEGGTPGQVLRALLDAAVRPAADDAAPGAEEMAGAVMARLPLEMQAPLVPQVLDLCVSRYSFFLRPSSCRLNGLFGLPGWRRSGRSACRVALRGLEPRRPRPRAIRRGCAVSSRPTCAPRSARTRACCGASALRTARTRPGSARPSPTTGAHLPPACKLRLYGLLKPMLPPEPRPIDGGCSTSTSPSLRSHPLSTCCCRRGRRAVAAGRSAATCSAASCC